MRHHSPIIVGIDDTDAAPRALALARELSRGLGVRCRLVHAVRSPWTSAPAPDASDAAAFEVAALKAAGDRIRATLRGHVSPEVLAHIDVRLGRVPLELNAAADEAEAEAIVIGGKRHSTFGRWFGSSTGHGLARLSTRPVLIAGPATAPVRRVLAAIDFSDSAAAVLEIAEQYAAVLKAELRVVTVVEPLPVTPGVTTIIDHDEYYRWSEAQLATDVWPRITYPGTEKVVRIGHPVETLLRELTDWAADLVVLGSHGRNVIERALLGSVSESLLNQLPTSLLLVPPPRRAGRRMPGDHVALAGAL